MKFEFVLLLLPILLAVAILAALLASTPVTVG